MSDSPLPFMPVVPPVQQAPAQPASQLAPPADTAPPPASLAAPMPPAPIAAPAAAPAPLPPVAPVPEIVAIPNDALLVAELSTNIKGQRKIELTRKTVIFGENESGKTAILDALRVAFTMKHPAGLDQLLPKGATDLRVSLKGALGTVDVVIPAAKLKNKTLDAPPMSGAIAAMEPEQRARLLPLTSVGNMLDGIGALRTREMLFRRYYKGDAELKPDGLSDDQEALWCTGLEDVATKARDGGDDIDPAMRLDAMRGWVASLQKKKSTEVKQLKLQVDEGRSAVIEESAGVENLPSLREQVSLAITHEAHAVSRQQLTEAREQYEVLQQRAQSLAERHAELKTQQSRLPGIEARTMGDISQFRVHNKKLTEESADTLARVARGDGVVDILNAMLDNNVNDCVVCGGACTDPNERLVVVQPAVEARRQSAAQVHAQMQQYETHIGARQQELATAQQAVAAIKNQLQEEQNGLLREGTGVQARIETLSQIVAQSTYAGPTEAELRAQIETLEAAEGRLRAFEALEAQLATAEKTHAATKALGAATRAKLKDAMTELKTTAEAAVNKYMHKGRRAELFMSGQNQCEWRDIGRDGLAHGKSASGAQRCALIAALKLSESDGLPRIIAVDDDDTKGFSPKAIFRFQQMLSQLVDEGVIQQVIVLTTRRSEISSDFDVIQLPDPEVIIDAEE